jgi:hypothetical protein
MHIPPSTTNVIDSLRKRNEDIANKVGETIGNISRIDTPEALQWALKEYFWGNKYKLLRNFFTRHPIRWIDLLRKIHKSRKNDNDKWWYINPSDVAEIYATFITRWREEDIWEPLTKSIQSGILENEKLISFASKQQSLLDSSGYSFSKISESKRRKNIQQMIEIWLIQNIKWCVYGPSLGLHFNKVFQKILKYLEEIFWLQYPQLLYCRSIDQLSKELESMFKSWKWRDRENAFRVIQSFHAWSNIEEIEKINNEANSVISKLPINFWKQWLPITNISQLNEDGVILYTWNIQYNGKNCKIVWRVKTVNSILQKMWDKEEYTNIDAVRDIVGISVIYPDNTTPEEKMKIMSAFAKIMPDFWYMLKDKWELNGTGDALLKELEIKHKNPIYTTEKRTDYTDPNFRNTSMSGYTRIWTLNIWCEIQFSTESASEWKKEDDKKYKPRGAISAFLRWPRIETPRQIYNLLNERMSPWTLKRLWFNSINELMIDMLNNGFLKAYTSSDRSIMLLSCEWRDKYVWNAFDGLINIPKEDDSYSLFLDILAGLNSD